MKFFCEQCKKPISEKVYNYSTKKYKKSLCREHQPSDNKKKVDKNNSNGLDERQSNYREGMIKGRIAETLIEELFLALGYNVFRYGMENTVPGIMKLLRGVRSDVAKNIRRMPDFVIQSQDTKDVFFLEVKFRKNEQFSISDLPIDYPFTNCYFIIVSKNHIKCITYPELKEGKTISEKSHNYLGSRKEFNLKKEVIIDFCNFAVKFFKEV
jgi:hypothetical protein